MAIPLCLTLGLALWGIWLESVPPAYGDPLPILTMLFVPGLLGGGIALGVAGLCRFWTDRRRGQLPLWALGGTLACYLVILGGYGIPGAAFRFAPAPALLNWGALAVIRLLYDRLAPKSSNIPEEEAAP